MTQLGLEREVVDRGIVEQVVARFREARVRLPTFAQLAEPASIPAATRDALQEVDPGAFHPANLFRVHWHNPAAGRGLVELPEHLELPPELTGVEARIVLLLGNRFPMIRSHKVLAAYGVLAPRLITGQFDPSRHRAVWPSTGNYCRGGVAISRILGCRGVAVLPEGMSHERFEWLERAVVDAREDVVRTPGTESNVKEIYDRCAVLERDPGNVIFNQFSEFGNHLVHWLCTGRAVERVAESLASASPGLRFRAFVAATGSAGTLGAGDYLREHHGTLVATAEALECPTLLYNGFGEHNIQGIGDKHVPLIHNVMSTDLVAGVSDRATDALDVLFNTEVGRRYLVERRRVDPATVEGLGDLGFSSICNLLTAVKLAKHYGWGREDLVVTVATDGAEMYHTERQRTLARDFPEGFDAVAAAEVFGRWLLGAATDHLLELGTRDRERIFNLGYFTWVEQQGVSIDDFVARRSPSFWSELRELLPVWDGLIEEVNRRVGDG
jgi:cysteine synthase A